IVSPMMTTAPATPRCCASTTRPRTWRVNVGAGGCLNKYEPDLPPASSTATAVGPSTVSSYALGVPNVRAAAGWPGPPALRGDAAEPAGNAGACTASTTPRPLGAETGTTPIDDDFDEPPCERPTANTIDPDASKSERASQVASMELPFAAGAACARPRVVM